MTGDRLRGQYQALSQDPNSLSNLDQDLPNNMIHQVPIKSLPQEWLWCETWCSKESLKDAKSIDLCNNPLTKVTPSTSPDNDSLSDVSGAEAVRRTEDRGRVDGLRRGDEQTGGGHQEGGLGGEKRERRTVD